MGLQLITKKMTKDYLLQRYLLNKQNNIITIQFNGLMLNEAFKNYNWTLTRMCQSLQELPRQLYVQMVE